MVWRKSKYLDCLSHAYPLFLLLFHMLHKLNQSPALQEFSFSIYTAAAAARTTVTDGNAGYVCAGLNSQTSSSSYQARILAVN